jgi:hypothetical protein
MTPPEKCQRRPAGGAVAAAEENFYNPFLAETAARDQAKDPSATSHVRIEPDRACWAMVRDEDGRWEWIIPRHSALAIFPHIGEG